MLRLETDPGRLEFEAGVGRRDVQKEVACAVNVSEPFLTYLYCLIAQPQQMCQAK